MHSIHVYRDPFGRLGILSATAAGPLDDPLKGLTPSQRFDVCRQPLNCTERQLLRASKRIPREQQRVVLHHILTERHTRYREYKASLVRKASLARQQDIVDDENARTRRHSIALRLEAERNQQAPDQAQDQGQTQP